MFQRIAHSIAVGNTDDHARNHAVLWDGTYLHLAPAYDLAPQPRSGISARQAMSFGDRSDPARDSSFALLLGAAAHDGLRSRDAKAIIDHVIDTIDRHFDEAADFARLSAHEHARLRGGVAGRFLNDGALLDYPRAQSV